MQPILLLCLALVPATLTAELKVPTGCVEIRNRDIDRFLVSSSGHDDDRRHVGYSGKAEQWWIQKEGDNYRIIHNKLGEELIESAQSWNGNYVFTWLAGDLTYNGLWKIYQASPKTNIFIIKNVKFGHCLWTKGIGGWIGAYEGCKGWEYQWQIHKFQCDDYGGNNGK